MASSAKNRTTIALYSVADDLHSHQVRFVLAEKGITVDLIDLDEDDDARGDLAELNPYNEAPTLVDRDMVLYGSSVICDYLDERYPHPPLMPVDPVSRARLRLVLYRVKRDWHDLADTISHGTPKKATAARKQLRESLTAADELFSVSDFLLHEELTLLDCSVVPLLWRIDHLKVKLTSKVQHLQAYAERMFQRPSFQASLSEAEKAMNPDAVN